MSLSDLTEDLRQFAAERDWDRFHNPKNFAMALSGEAGELAAPFTWVSEVESSAMCQDPEFRQKLKGEVGDILNNLLQFCRHAGIDAEEAAREKLAELKLRYDPEEQKRSGGFVRIGADGQRRETIVRK